MKPLVYVKRVYVPLEEQFKYLSEESSDSSDEEWTMGPAKKKKQDKNEPKSAGIDIPGYFTKLYGNFLLVLSSALFLSECRLTCCSIAQFQLLAFSI